MTMDHQRTIVIGISGVSSSGKTTLARLLRDLFPETFILHEDDFYKPESELPITYGHVDWDCPEAISIPDMHDALVHIRETGTFPPTLDSKEDLNTVGALPLTPSQLATTTAKIAAWLQPGHPGSRIFSQNPKQKIKLCLLDGFLLYAPPPHPLAAILPLLDIKLFLRTDRRRAVERRAARDGYVTLEGFWKDPPGYVEDVVWPNYVAAHRWLFEGGEVEGGRVDGEVLRREGIFAAPFDGEREDGGFGEVLAWAVGVVMRELERICLGEGVDGTEN